MTGAPEPHDWGGRALGPLAKTPGHADVSAARHLAV